MPFMTMKSQKRKIKFEFNEGPYQTNASEYIPTRARVEQYMSAGRMLSNYRESVDWNDYLSQLDAENADLDPTTQKGFDPADLTRLENDARRKVKFKTDDVKEDLQQVQNEAGKAQEVVKSAG